MGQFTNQIVGLLSKLLCFHNLSVNLLPQRGILFAPAIPVRKQTLYPFILLTRSRILR